jgi:hypothetical protein
MALTMLAGAGGVRVVAVAAVAGVALMGCRGAPLDALTIDPSSLSRDLVAHWTFDATGGTTVPDSSGNGYHGVVTGGTWISSGRFEGAISLASGDSVAVADFPQATASWTVSLWTRASAANLAASTSDWSTILSTEIQFAGGWEIHLDNRPEYQRFDTAYWAGATIDDYVRVFCPCIEPDRWIHLTTVWDAVAAKMTLFRDDELVDEVPMPSPIQTGDTTLYLGRWNQAGRYLAGDIDDVAIWRRALQLPEIARLSLGPPGR